MKSSNIQFGEGGAGTFSDGKLMTRINDGFCRVVLEEFVAHGAPKADPNGCQAAYWYRPAAKGGCGNPARDCGNGGRKSASMR